MEEEDPLIRNPNKENIDEELWVSMLSPKG